MKKKDQNWKYKAILGINIAEAFIAVSIIYFAVNYSYWILLLLLILGCSETEKRILGIKEE